MRSHSEPEDVVEAEKHITQGFPRGPAVKNPAANAGDTGWTPGSRRSSGGGNGNPLQYCCLKNSVHRGAWWDIAHRVTKSLTQLSDFHSLIYP